MKNVLPVCAGLALVLGSLAACGPTEEEIMAQQRAEEWTAVGEARDALQALRDEANAIQAKVDQGAEALELDEEGFAALQEELTAKIEEVNGAADSFSGQLVQFINNGVDQDLEESQEHLDAIRMKSSEDLLLAADYVQRGGDYRRAVQILETQAQFDTDNAELAEKLAYYKDWRYITKERFDQLKKGMTQQEVRDTIGVPYHRNVRDYPEQKSEGWFYQKDKDGPDAGEATAVFFRKSGGEWKVTQLMWEAQ